MYHRHLGARAQQLEPVEIRKVVDLIQGEDAIPLAAGWPNPKSFPVTEIGDLVQDGLDEYGAEMLQYGVTRGNERLRTAIADRLETRFNVTARPEEIMITSGSQQALYLLSRALLEDDDLVVTGAPTYVAALSAFEALIDPEYLTVSLDEDGLELDQLESALEDRSPAFVYVVPTFQNPTGITMSASRRQRLVKLAHDHDFLIIEDTPYAELSFEAEPPAPIASLDRDRTIHLGSFSKILAPGFRVGWMVAPEELLETIELLKQPNDLHTSTFSQHVATVFLTSGLVDDQIERITESYASKRDLALETLDATMPHFVNWTQPGGGMFLWLTLPSRFDAEAMLTDAIDDGVAYIPGHAFYAVDAQYNTIRINYTYVNDEQLEEGIDRLATTIRRFDPKTS